MMKAKSLLRYVFFVAYGQYKQDKMLLAYCGSIIFEILCWLAYAFVLAFLYVHGFLAKELVLALLFVLKCPSAILEKKQGFALGYDLKKYFPIQTVEIFALRLFTKFIMPYEHAFWGILGYFSFAFYAGPYALHLATMLILLSIVLYEALAYATYCPRFQFFCAKSRNLEASKRREGVPSLLLLLVKKDIHYLLTNFMTFLFSPCLLLVILYGLGEREWIYALLPYYFPLELSIAYGFNYFGHEQKTLPLLLLSPLPKALWIQSKQIGYVCFSFCLSVLAFGLLWHMGAYALEDAIAYFAMVLLAIGALTFLNIHFSIRYYYPIQGKRRFTIRLWVFIVLLFILFALSSGFVFSWKASSVVVLMISFLLFVLLFYFSAIRVQTYAQKIDRLEKTWLKQSE